MELERIRWLNVPCTFSQPLTKRIHGGTLAATTWHAANRTLPSGGTLVVAGNDNQAAIDRGGGLDGVQRPASPARIAGVRVRLILLGSSSAARLAPRVAHLPARHGADGASPPVYAFRHGKRSTDDHSVSVLSRLKKCRVLSTNLLVSSFDFHFDKAGDSLSSFLLS